MGMNKQPRAAQAGVALLEVMIAILIISFGILGIIGLQANSITITNDARYRIEASNFAERLVAEMWVDPVNLASYAWNGVGSPPGVLATWANEVLSSTRSLPGASSYKPTITIAADNLVTISICWSPPQLGTGVASQPCDTVPADKTIHKHVVIASINQDYEN
jgi:type IV pilus assembly protein PilV